MQGIRQLPTQHVATVPIPDRHQVEKATAHLHERNVREPDKIGLLDREILQKIRLAQSACAALPESAIFLEPVELDFELADLLKEWRDASAAHSRYLQPPIDEVIMTPARLLFLIRSVFPLKQRTFDSVISAGRGIGRWGMVPPAPIEVGTSQAPLAGHRLPSFD